jgi:hypothetical protein
MARAVDFVLIERCVFDCEDSVDEMFRHHVKRHGAPIFVAPEDGNLTTVSIEHDGALVEFAKRRTLGGRDLKSLADLGETRADQHHTAGDSNCRHCASATDCRQPRQQLRKPLNEATDHALMVRRSR